MEKFKVEPEADGVSVCKMEVDTDGKEVIGSRWHMQGDQIEKHIRGIDDPGHHFNKVARGDLSAARDMASEARKQIES